MNDNKIENFIQISLNTFLLLATLAGQILSLTDKIDLLDKFFLYSESKNALFTFTLITSLAIVTYRLSTSKQIGPSSIRTPRFDSETGNWTGDRQTTLSDFFTNRVIFFILSFIVFISLSFSSDINNVWLNIIQFLSFIIIWTAATDIFITLSVKFYNDRDYERKRKHFPENILKAIRNYNAIPSDNNYRFINIATKIDEELGYIKILTLQNAINPSECYKIYTSSDGIDIYRCEKNDSSDGYKPGDRGPTNKGIPFEEEKGVLGATKF